MHSAMQIIKHNHRRILTEATKADAATPTEPPVMCRLVQLPLPGIFSFS